MDERDQLERLAKDFVALWQEHVAELTRDPALARWADGMAAALAGAGGDALAAAGAAAAGPASGDLGRRLDDLARRLAGCEERLAALERRDQGGGREAAPRPGGGRC